MQIKEHGTNLPEFCHKNWRGVTLMELLLVVAIMAIIAPLAVPTATSYLASRGDIAATQNMIDMVAHVRSMGLLGRTTESVITFNDNAAVIDRGGRTVALPAGFTVGGLKVDGAGVVSLSVVFKIDGNIVCNNSTANTASVELKRDGQTISTVQMNGLGIPVPVMTAAVDPANPSGSGSSNSSCRWF